VKLREPEVIDYTRHGSAAKVTTDGPEHARPVQHDEPQLAPQRQHAGAVGPGQDNSETNWKGVGLQERLERQRVELTSRIEALEGAVQTLLEERHQAKNGFML
jgi:hypothetical protein